MAGIGFELRRYLADDSFTGTLKAYGFAGLVSAGPWVLSIVGVLLVGIVAVSTATEVVDGEPTPFERFTTAVTWMMAASLILTGPLQLPFTRFVADRLYERRMDIVNPNLIGILVTTTALALILGLVSAWLWFDESPVVEWLLLSHFAVLCNVWIVLIFVAGLKRLKAILVAFTLGYTTLIVLAVLWMPHGLSGLLAGSLIGHAVLLFALLAVVIPEHPLDQGPRFDFLRPGAYFPSLVFVGLFYNLGIWIDKLIFWSVPATSSVILGPFRSSVIYDLPIFLAYLSIIPGMAVFLLRIETDFAEAHARFYEAVCGNASLAEIKTWGTAMTTAVREGLLQIARVQLVTILLLYLVAPTLLEALGLSAGYVGLFYVNLVGVAGQVLLLAVLNVLFYLDRRTQAWQLTGLMLVSNALFTAVTLWAGTRWYGYGFGVSMSLCAAIGTWMLSRELQDIEFRTFMRPRVSSSRPSRDAPEAGRT